MTPVQLAIELNKITSGRTVYLKCEPEVLDFTSKEPKAKIVLFSPENSLTIDLEPKKLVFGLLGIIKEALNNVSVICWNIKPLFSYIRYFTKTDFDLNSHLVDLKVLEYYSGTHQDAPRSHAEAVLRVKSLFGPEWLKIKSIFRNIYLPLITKIIPNIETYGMLDTSKRTILHPYYDIAGQVNGRLLCTGAFSKNYIPHRITPEEKLSFRAKEGETFVLLDYKHMEVSMLQWLSGDENLLKIMSVDEDLYKVFYKLISGGGCDTEKKREIAKSFLLPLIYGESVGGLAKNLGVSEVTAEKIVTKVNNLMPKALKWVASQKVNEYNIAIDVFGRKRLLVDKQYRIRDFSVQSPASLVCLEKLGKLDKPMKGYGHIVCHIHDGFLLSSPDNQAKTVVSIAKAVLESDSELAPGVKLKVTCKVGKSLAEMVDFCG